MAQQSPNKQGEAGYILITAIWLLLLAGSIAALLMLRSLTASTAASDRQKAIENTLALEAALETIFADRLINGVSSQWWLLPAQGNVAIEGLSANVQLSSESGRIDINQASPSLIAAALQGLGVPPVGRERFINRIQSLRGQKRLVRSFAELRQIESEAIGQSLCLEDHLTFVSGLAEPRRDQASPELAKALGYGTGSGPAPPEAGAALRIHVRLAEGQSLTSIVRFSADRQQPLAVSSWEWNKNCIS